MFFSGNFWKFMTSNKFLPAWNYKLKLNLWPAATFLGKMRLNMVIAVWHLIVHLVTNCYLISQDNAMHYNNTDFHCSVHYNIKMSKLQNQKENGLVEIFRITQDLVDWHQIIWSRDMSVMPPLTCLAISSSVNLFAFMYQ